MKLTFVGRPVRNTGSCQSCSGGTDQRIGDSHTIEGVTYMKGRVYTVDKSTGVYLLLTGLFKEV